jgi:DNA-binding MarR family transcriptional regulator
MIKYRYKSPNRLFITIAIFLILMVSTFFTPLVSLSNIQAETENNGSIGTNPNSPRAVNKDTEPNNDFGNASIIQYNPSKTTHVFNASVGSGTDPRDFWRLNTDKGTIKYSGDEVIGAENPDKITILLSFNETNQMSNGVYMNIYDADYHKLGSSRIAIESDPVSLIFIGQVNPYVYLEILSNPQDNNYNYVMSIKNETISNNPVFINDERFQTTREVNITKGITLNNEYLDKAYDFADFYKFEAFKDQKIEIDMMPNTNSEDDFDIFLFSGENVSKEIVSSTKIKQPEKITYYSPINHTYYLRVGIKNIADPNLRNMGDYKLTFIGNLPPQMNKSYPNTFIMQEDGPDLVVDINNAFFELNPSDQFQIEVLDPNVALEGGYWVGLDDLNSIVLSNLSILPDGDVIKNLLLKTKPNKFGTEIVHIRATDDLTENYTYVSLLIIIRPTNDPPVINNTIAWETGRDVWADANGKTIYGLEGEEFECTVTAYEPVDPYDSITFSDDTHIFDIDPKTGKIAFLATYNYTGVNKVKITVTDNGTPPMSTSKDCNFLIKQNAIHPEVKLLGPTNNSVQFTLQPVFKWEQVNEYFEDSIIFYDIYLSSDKNLVLTNNEDAFIKTIVDDTIFSLPIEFKLEDQTTYYWSVIPNDGSRKGTCLSVFNKFEVNLNEPIPRVKIVYPLNNQIITTDSVELQWSLDFTGKGPVSYEVYYGLSKEELEDPFAEPNAYTDKSYHQMETLYFNKNYYWMIVPFTNRVKANDSEIFMFHAAKEAPEALLTSPADRSILIPNTDVVFNWRINYTSPKQVRCLLFIDSDPNFENTQPIETDDSNSYLADALKKGIYYWRVVPYIGNLLGIGSDVWTFLIEDVVVPKAVLKEPMNTTYYSAKDPFVLSLSWYVEYRFEFDYKNVWFDVYLDNSTNMPTQMKKINTEKLRQTFFETIIPIEEGKMYYWYVIPHLETQDGIITGISDPGITSFTFGPENITYKIAIELETDETTLEPGSTRIIKFYLRNQGNVKATIDLYVTTNGEGYINPVLNEKTVVLPQSDNRLISLNIFVLENVEIKNYTLKIKAVVRESTVVKAEEDVTIEIPYQDGPPPPTPQKEDWLEENLGILIVLMIIILLVSLFSYSKIKRHKLLQHQRRELIFNYVKENPGEHFRGIQKALNLEVGVLAHHINKLEREEFVKSRQDGKYRRFYPMDAKINIRLILSEIQERILSWIKKNPGASGSTIATNLGVDRKLVNYHVNVLEKGGFIYTEPRGKEKLCYSVQN